MTGEGLHPMDALLASATSSCLEILSARRRTSEPIWQPSDGWALYRVVALEQRMEQDPLPASLMTDAQRTEYRKTLRRYHAALPFTEPERGLLCDLDWDAECFLRDAGREEEVVSEGLRQVISGPELGSRWLDWRAGTGAYEDRRVRKLACAALGDAVALIAAPASSR